MLLSFKILTIVIVYGHCQALEEIFKWKELKFNVTGFPNAASSLLVPPSSFEVYEERIFIVIPNWNIKGQHPFTLGYINQNDPKNAAINPYPSASAHGKDKDIFSAMHVSKDICDRLWVLDTGAKKLNPTSVITQTRNPKILIYNLTDNTLIRSYNIPSNQYTNESLMVNIVVETDDCMNEFAYIADNRPALIVYSFEKNSSWVVQDDSFSRDENHIKFHLHNVVYKHSRNLASLCINYRPQNIFLYYSPFSSLSQYEVDTANLHSTNVTPNVFKKIGNKHSQTPSCGVYVDEDVVFFGYANITGLSCWDAKKKFTKENINWIGTDNETMIYVADIKFEENTLWALTTRLPKYFDQTLNSSEFNFRILRSNIKDLIAQTSCETERTKAKSGNSNNKVFFSHKIFYIIFLVINVWKYLH